MGMELSGDLGLRECVLVGIAWGRDHDASAGQWQRLDILGQHAARWSGRERLPHCPRQGQSSTSSRAALQKISSRYCDHLFHCAKKPNSLTTHFYGKHDFFTVPCARPYVTVRKPFQIEGGFD